MAISKKKKRGVIKKFLNQYKKDVKQGVSGAANITEGTAKAFAAFPFAFLGVKKDSRAAKIARKLLKSGYKDLDEAFEKK